MSVTSNSIIPWVKIGSQIFYIGEIVDFDMYAGKKKLSRITELGTIVVWVQHLEDNLLSSGNLASLRKDRLGNLLYG